MIDEANYRNAIEQVMLTLEDCILHKVKTGEIKKASGDNIRTSLHRFQEFIDSLHNSTGIKSSPFISQMLPTPKEIVEEIEEDDYDIEILRKKSQARIASGQRREFPARVLNSILKK